ncbi:MAG: glycosyltransferase [Phycisphaerales bacterium]|nr:glycosyltransferase [Phycisphaerales bacterium]
MLLVTTMTRFPKISIVTPSYNQAKYVPWTVRSVLLQRYPNLEYVVMDGGSKDDTVEVLKPYVGRLAHFQSARDKGQSDAIKQGFARCTGDVMAYLNSDDMLAPGALHWVADFFRRHPDVDAVYSHRVTVDGQNRAKWYWVLPPHSDWYQTRWDLIPQETCFWRRRLFDAHGSVDDTLRFAIDYDLFARYMLKGAKFVRADRFLGVFREHEDAKTSQLLNTVGAAEVAKVRERYGIALGRLAPLVSARFYYGALRNGERFAHERRRLPGCLPGVGYDYDTVWGGLLDEPGLPPAAAEAADEGIIRRAAASVTS